MDFNDILSASFLNNTILNNTIQQYLIFLSILVSSYIFAKLVYLILKRYVKRVTRKTETVIDDIIIRVIRGPLVFLVFITGTYFGTKMLTLSLGAQSILRNIYLMLVIISIVYALNKLVDRISTDYFALLMKKKETKLDEQMIPLLQKTAKILIFLFTILIVLNIFGVNITSLLAGLGIGGLAIALAAKDTIANIFGAITIYIDKPFKINDRVRIAGYEGFVEEIGLRSIKLRTRDRTSVSIPNSIILTQPAENLYQLVLRRIILKLSIDCNTSNKKIERLIKLIPQELNKIPDLDKEYTQMHFINFGSYGLDFEVRYMIKQKSNRRIRDVKHQANITIKKVLEEENITLPYPTQEIHLKK